MTISSTGPLVAVVGATGKQGGSVIKYLSQSDKSYKIRAITRDASKPAAKKLSEQGCEVTTADISTADGAKKAFAGAQIAFGVTNFWEHMDGAKELRDGKTLVDAAADAGVDLFIYSGLASHTKLSDGKYTHVDHFDVKAEVVEYATQKLAGKFCSVEPGSYADNWTGGLGPKPMGEGKFALFSPASPQGKWAIVDIAEYGLWVRYAIEHRKEAGNRVLAASEELSGTEIAEAISKASGKSVSYVEISDEQFNQAAPMPEPVKTEFREMIRSVTEFGYYGKADFSKTTAQLSPKPSTFLQFAEKQDWSKVLQ